MRVICVGLPQTGAPALAAALTELLGGKSYDAAAFLKGADDDDLKHWYKVLGGRAEARDWKEFEVGIRILQGQMNRHK